MSMSSQYTKRILIDSLIQLLNQKTVDDISIKDITSNCGFNRNTFYYHYENKDELINDLFLSEIKRLKNVDPELKDIRQDLIVTMNFALNNKQAIINLYNSNYLSLLDSYIKNILDGLLKLYFENKSTNIQVSEDRLNFIVKFYAYAFYGMIMEWIKSGMQDDALQLINNLAQIIENDSIILLKQN